MENAVDTTNWIKYPFTVDGIDFVSLVDPKGTFYPQLEALPAEVLNNFNEQAIRDLIGSPADFSLAQLQDELDQVNLGHSQALLALA